MPPAGLSAPALDLDQLLQGLSPGQKCRVKGNFDATSYASALKSQMFSKIAICFAEAPAAHAAAAAAFSLNSHTCSPSSEDIAHCALGPHIALITPHHMQCCHSSRLVFTTTETLLSQLMFARAGAGYDCILMCYPEPADPYFPLVVECAGAKGIAVAEVHM